VKYADQPLLTGDIQKVDALYLWFVRLKKESIAQRGSGIISSRVSAHRDLHGARTRCSCSHL
jgi:hypothetical protein